jgi:hypothetical protein
MMTESKDINNYRDLLNLAPFSWSNINGPSNVPQGLFSLPQVILNNSFASTRSSNNEDSPQKDIEMLECPPERRQLIQDDEYQRYYDTCSYAR